MRRGRGTVHVTRRGKKGATTGLIGNRKKIWGET